MQAITESNEAIGSIEEMLDKSKCLDDSDRAYLQGQIANAKAIQALAFAVLELANQTNRMRGRVN